MASTEKVSETASKSDEQINKTDPAASLSKVETEADDDEESDFEDLDDVLDDFNNPKQASNVKPEAPETPAIAESSSIHNPLVASQATLGANEFDEDELMKQLEADMMANFLGSDGGKGKAPTAATKPDTESTLPGISEDEIEKFSEKLKDGGITMEDLLRGILDIAEDPEEQQGPGKRHIPGSSSAVGAERGIAAGKGEGTTFQDTIQETLKRMQESGDKATAAAATNPDELRDELFGNLAQLLESEMAGETGDGLMDSMQEVFTGIMKDVSNKEMLYEPMKEYHAKYGPWLEANRDTVPEEDFARYQTQARVVKEIVEKFDEEGYSDEKPECLAYIWDRMQQMEAAGAPPEEIMAKPDSLEIPSDAQVPPECTPQ